VAETKPPQLEDAPGEVLSYDEYMRLIKVRESWGDAGVWAGFTAQTRRPFKKE
jgi:hypothetical protein